MTLARRSLSCRGMPLPASMVTPEGGQGFSDLLLFGSLLL